MVSVDPNAGRKASDVRFVLRIGFLFPEIPFRGAYGQGIISPGNKTRVPVVIVSIPWKGQDMKVNDKFYLPCWHGTQRVYHPVKVSYVNVNGTVTVQGEH